MLRHRKDGGRMQAEGGLAGASHMGSRGLFFITYQEEPWAFPTIVTVSMMGHPSYSVENLDYK